MSQPISATPITEILGNLTPLVILAELLRTGFGFTATTLPLAEFYTWYCLWLGVGHLALYTTNSFPMIRRSNWVRGSITAMIALCWPAWLAFVRQAQPKPN